MQIPARGCSWFFSSLLGAVAKCGKNSGGLQGIAGRGIAAHLPDQLRAQHKHRPAHNKLYAAGKAAAVNVHQLLSGAKVAGPEKLLNVRTARPGKEQLASLAACANPAERVVPAGGPVTGFTLEEAQLEATRCLDCDCGKKIGCRLRHYAHAYGALTNRFGGQRYQNPAYDLACRAIWPS